MKKFLGVLLVVLAMVFVLAGCAPTEDYAKKINDAAKTEDYLTYKQVKGHLGKEDEILEAKGSLFGITVDTGYKYCAWYKGAKNGDDAQEKANKGKDVYVLVVTFDGNDKAKSASWSKVQSNEK